MEGKTAVYEEHGVYRSFDTLHAFWPCGEISDAESHEANPNRHVLKTDSQLRKVVKRAIKACLQALPSRDNNVNEM